jgi:hypothetical protein
MRNISIIFTLLFFWSCTSCNSSDPKNDSDNTADSDTKNDIDSVKTDNDINDSTVENDIETDESNLDADINDEWERDVEIPDMSGNPYWEEYSDSDKNIAYYYYGDKPVKSSDPEDVKALWSKKCGGDMCVECEPVPYDLCAENYPFEAQIINGKGTNPWKASSTAGEFQCDALLTAGWWYTTNLANSVQFSEIDGKVIYLLDNNTTSWQGGHLHMT